MVRRAMILMAVLVLVTAALPAVASATTTRIPFTYASGVPRTLDEGDRVMHGTLLVTRGMVQATPFISASPYVNGTSTVTINFNLDLATGDGDMWGKEVLEPAAYPDGGYTCSWHATWDNWQWDGRDVCHGYGTLDGVKVVYFMDTRFATMNGFVMNPGQ